MRIINVYNQARKGEGKEGTLKDFPTSVGRVQMTIMLGNFNATESE